MQNIILKILKYILKTVPDSEIIDVTLDLLKESIEKTPIIFISERDIKSKVASVLFAKKYAEKFPSIDIEMTVKRYLSLSKKGDDSFKKEPLFRELRRQKDPVLRKINYRLSRTLK